MPGTAMAKQAPNTNGVVPTYNVAVAANSIQNNGRTLLHVKNGSGASINVTLVATATQDGVAMPNKVIAVAAGAEKMIGPIPPGLYNFSDGTCEVDFSATGGTILMAAWDIP